MKEDEILFKRIYQLITQRRYDLEEKLNHCIEGILEIKSRLEEVEYILNWLEVTDAAEKRKEGILKYVKDIIKAHKKDLEDALKNPEECFECYEEEEDLKSKYLSNFYLKAGIDEMEFLLKMIERFEKKGSG